MRKEIGKEEAFHRRTDHLLPGRNRSGTALQGAMPSLQFVRSQLLFVAQPIFLLREALRPTMAGGVKAIQRDA